MAPRTVRRPVSVDRDVVAPTGLGRISGTGAEVAGLWTPRTTALAGRRSTTHHRGAAPSSANDDPRRPHVRPPSDRMRGRDARSAATSAHSRVLTDGSADVEQRRRRRRDSPEGTAAAEEAGSRPRRRTHCGSAGCGARRRGCSGRPRHPNRSPARLRSIGTRPSRMNAGRKQSPSGRTQLHPERSRRGARAGAAVPSQLVRPAAQSRSGRCPGAPAGLERADDIRQRGPRPRRLPRRTEQQRGPTSRQLVALLTTHGRRPPLTAPAGGAHRCRWRRRAGRAGARRRSARERAAGSSGRARSRDAGGTRLHHHGLVAAPHERATSTASAAGVTLARQRRRLGRPWSGRYACGRHQHETRPRAGHPYEARPPRAARARTRDPHERHPLGTHRESGTRAGCGVEQRTRASRARSLVAGPTCARQERGRPPAAQQEHRHAEHRGRRPEATGEHHRHGVGAQERSRAPPRAAGAMRAPARSTSVRRERPAALRPPPRRQRPRTRSVRAHRPGVRRARRRVGSRPAPHGRAAPLRPRRVHGTRPAALGTWCARETSCVRGTRRMWGTATVSVGPSL